MTSPQPAAPLCVSVIVRTKNRPENLKYCLQSIVAQTHRPLEIIIINDGGEDVSHITNLFDQNESNELQFQLLQFKDSEGRTRAANHGLEAATGQYINFLDDDDYWHPHHLSTLTEQLPSHPCAIYSAAQAVNATGDLAGEETPIKVFNTPFDREHLLYNNFLPILSVLFHRSVIDDAIRLDEGFDLFEDWDFWLQVSEKLPFVSTPEITCVYRIHPQASGVHQQARADEAYRAIYRKWLPKDKQELQQLLMKSHQWHALAIEQLQASNQVQLDAIGQQHSQALAVIAERDASIQLLNQSLENLGKEYEHAIQVIQEKDLTTENLAKEYKHAIQVIGEKDRAAEQLAGEYEHAIEVIRQKDLDIKQLAAERNEFEEEIRQLRELIKNPLLLLRQKFLR